MVLLQVHHRLIREDIRPLLEVLPRAFRFRREFVLVKGLLPSHKFSVRDVVGLLRDLPLNFLHPFTKLIERPLVEPRRFVLEDRVKERLLAGWLQVHPRHDLFGRALQRLFDLPGDVVLVGDENVFVVEDYKVV
jgi:hypothetical protein